MGQDEHEVEILTVDDRYQAQCCCGWRSIVTPDQKVADFHAGRHGDANR